MPSRIDRREFIKSGGAAVGLTATGISLSETTKSSEVEVAGLKVDNISQPLGLENKNPRFSWKLVSQRRNVRQTAYRILVATSETALSLGRGDVWDSGRVNSRSSLGVKYRGPQLKSRLRYYWCVQIWEKQRTTAISSAASWWEMGLLEPKDWTMQWLAVEDTEARGDREEGLHWIWSDSTPAGPSRKFRFTFELTVPSLSGELVAAVNDLPVWMQITRVWVDGIALAGYGSYVDLTSYEKLGESPLVTSRLRLPLKPMNAGKHVVAVEVHARPFSNLDAEFNPDIEFPPFEQSAYVPGFAALVRLDLQGEKTIRLRSDQTWKTNQVEDSDWYQRHYDDASWKAAQPVLIEGYQPWPPQPALRLRHDFSLRQSIKQGRLYVTALGVYEARINGQRVGDALLTPEPSQYSKRTLYQVYDVTALLQRGENVLGMTVGDGWYAGFDGSFAYAPPPRRVLAQLEVVLSDGSREIIGTSPDWRAGTSPVVLSEVKTGEVYDARMEQPGWDNVGFNDDSWHPAQIAESPPCRLVAQVSPPVRHTRTLNPKSISEPRPGVYVVDFGQYFTGWCRLRATGRRGSRVELRFAESLLASGEVDQSGMYDFGGGPKRDIFVLQGTASGEILQPLFSCRGFQYVQISGLDAPLTPELVEGICIHTDLAVTGQIRSNHPLVGQIWQSVRRTIESNFVAIPVDNTIREFRGWTGEATRIWETAAYALDICSFGARYMADIVDDQSADGAFPIVAPEPKHANSYYHQRGAVPAWSDAGIILPHTSWRHYKDDSIIEANFVAMRRYLKFIETHNPDFIWKSQRSHDFGDWMAIDRTTPKDLIATAYWAHSANLLSEMAKAIGFVSEASQLRALHERIRTAFNEAYIKSDGIIGSDSQTGYVLAVQFNLLDEKDKMSAVERLAVKIQEKGTALTTGLLGTQYVLDVLFDNGRADLAYALLLRTEIPSWGYMLKSGSSTIWESWGVKFAGARSQPPLASVGGFLFRCLAGIRADSAGFETIIIKPRPHPLVSRGGGDFDSVMGRISVDWTQSSDEGFSMTVTIPANATARIHLPARLTSRITEGGRDTEGRRDISALKEIRLLERLEREAVLEVGSGSYSFAVS